ncbi:ExeA family protein [Paludibaculum fermentans]|uniref:AAA family ATPase n=1 Tax=Paludibaculum fermentans TaxID=1473598 RepID=A0A7S7NTJ5_PALFE|nr:AAA family ATPase [Paludibaculum fermentans]QOY89555.1 AAA family ATPase [Paludibaculum fermentans]
MGPTEWRIETPSLVIGAPAYLLAELGESAMAGRAAAGREIREIGGVLFGRRSPEGVRVEAYRAVTCEHAEGPGFRLSARDREGLAEVLEAASREEAISDLEPVGWYRTEYRDMFFSENDQKLYQQFFPHPWQIALILRWSKTEPVQAGVYTRDLNGRAKFRCSLLTEVPVQAPGLSGVEAQAEAAPLGETRKPSEATPAWESLGLTHDPFPARLDTSFVRVSTQHREAVAELYYGVKKRAGLMLLTGEPGSGRREVLESLGDLFNQQRIEFAYLLEAPKTLERFYELISYDLALPCASPSKMEVLAKLTELAARQNAAQSTLVLILDEADPMPVEVMADIGLLDHMQNRHGKLLQVILAGSPELEARLSAPELRDLNLLISQRLRLHRMDEAEVAEYAEGRLQRAGAAKVGIIPAARLAVIASQSKGLPLEVHRLCGAYLEALVAGASSTSSTLRLQGMLNQLRDNGAE